MASSKDRQRRLERARQERRIARQAAAQRRRRQIQAAVGSFLALALIVVGTVWLLGGFESKPTPEPTIASGDCTWYLRKPSAEQNISDTGHPPTTGISRSGTVPMTISTNLGSITVSLDRSKSPCAIESMAYLAGKKYFDGTSCHRVTTSGRYVLQCGDPSGTGSGGPSYSYDTEYVPTQIAAPTATPSASPGGTASASPSASPSPSPSAADDGLVTYPKGTVAIANSGGTNTNGSQFFIVYKDSPLPPSYSVIGSVLLGLNVVETVAKDGTDTPGQTDGRPKTQISIDSLVITVPEPSDTSESPSASPTATASPTSP